MKEKSINGKFGKIGFGALSLVPESVLQRHDNLWPITLKRVVGLFLFIRRFHLAVGIKCYVVNETRCTAEISGKKRILYIIFHVKGFFVFQKIQKFCHSAKIRRRSL